MSSKSLIICVFLALLIGYMCHWQCPDWLADAMTTVHKE